VTQKKQVEKIVIEHEDWRRWAAQADVVKGGVVSVGKMSCPDNREELETRAGFLYCVSLEGEKKNAAVKGREMAGNPMGTPGEATASLISREEGRDSQPVVVGVKEKKREESKVEIARRKKVGMDRSVWFLSQWGKKGNGDHSSYPYHGQLRGGETEKISVGRVKVQCGL